MYTITVDDKMPVVNMMLRLLGRIDPDGEHEGCVDSAKALEMMQKSPAEVAFLDVDMPGMNGIELAKRIQKIHPLCTIVFITGYEEYMKDAFDLYASAYIMKPVTETAIRKALANLRYRPETPVRGKLKVRCFGTFEVFSEGVPLHFGRSKAKELFAYMIDRRGAICTHDMIAGNIWADEPPSEAVKGKTRVVLSDLTSTLSRAGFEDVIIRGNGGVSVNLSRVDCDYYRYLDGDAHAIHAFFGEYMSQYEFGEETRIFLQGRMN